MSLRIKEVIKEENLSVQEVAERMGISRVGLSQHLNGNPSAEVLERIAQAMNVPVWRFFHTLDEIVEQEKNLIRCPKCGARFELKEE